MPVPRGGADSVRGGGRRPVASPEPAPARKAPRPSAPQEQGAAASSASPRAPSSSSLGRAPARK
eukprot:4041198-Alexandrium_andersonii.AAC.1